MNDPNLIFGYDTVGDAGVYKLREDLAIIQTVDVLTPIADDPHTFGQIAAANALSDVYVMGGRPVTALNIIGFPAKLDLSILTEMLKGGGQKTGEAGAVILGGHTIKDDDLKYGLAITAVIHPKDLVTNEGAKPGDDLILTKPLGTGVISTALKAGIASASAIEKINAQMCELNKTAAEVMMDVGVNACTDITGFGLLGHAAQMAQASGRSLSIDSYAVPIIDEAREYAAQSLFPGGSVKNFEFVKPSVRFSDSVDDDMQMLLCDAQTSGGLLMSVDKSRSDEMISALRTRGVVSAMRIGEVAEHSGASIYIQ